MPLAGTQSIPAISKPQFGTKSLADRSCNLIRGSLDKSRENPGSFGFSRLNCLANFRKFYFETSQMTNLEALRFYNKCWAHCPAPFLRKKG
jgi:hypothetical protein